MGIRHVKLKLLSNNGGKYVKTTYIKTTKDTNSK
jgi:hypothetical protein